MSVMLVSPQWHKGQNSVGSVPRPIRKIARTRSAGLTCRRRLVADRPLRDAPNYLQSCATNRVIDEQHDYGANDGNNHAVNV